MLLLSSLHYHAVITNDLVYRYLPLEWHSGTVGWASDLRSVVMGSSPSRAAAV